MINLTEKIISSNRRSASDTIDTYHLVVRLHVYTILFSKIEDIILYEVKRPLEYKIKHMISDT